MPHFSPEVRRLLTYFAACDSQKPLPRVAVDWTELVEAIQRHRIIGPTYYTLSQESQSDYPPPTFQRTIQLLHYKNALQTAKMYQNVYRVVDQLAQQDIDFMIVKGPVLAHTVYPVPAIRYFRDLDFVIRERDRVQTEKALSRIGYNIKNGAINYLPQLTPEVVALRHSQYYNQQIPMPLEVHWENFLVDDMVLRDMESIWRRATDVSIGDAVVKSPSLEDHLIHLCAHAHSHRFEKLFWLSDILLIVRDHADKIDWDLFLRTVTAEAIELPVYYSFKLLNALFDQEVPAEVMNRTRPDRLRQWFHERFIPEEESHLLSGEDHPPISFKSTPFYESTIQNLLVMSRRTDKIKFLFRLLFPSREWLRYRYNLSAGHRVIPYYFIRLIPPKEVDDLAEDAIL